MEDLIKEGMVLNLEYGEGTIINIAKKEGKLYINVGFGDTTFEDAFFRIYLVTENQEGVVFTEVKDNNLYQELASEWISDAFK